MCRDYIPPVIRMFINILAKTIIYEIAGDKITGGTDSRHSL